jgi:hypothetical protein
MNKFKFYFILSITTLSLFSCSKNDSVEITPPRAYADQYITDIAVIEDYLNTYYLDMDLTDPNFADKDVLMTKIPVGGIQPPIMSYKANAYLGSTIFPQLWTRNVKLHDVNYTLYYLVLREGTGESPCNVDGVLTSYRGDYLESIAATTTTPASTNAVKFEEIKYPQSFFSLYSTVAGWGETFPQFKKGTYKTNTDGTITYENFGAGVMFLPSGLAYFNASSGSIPSYSPLVFSFKLYELQRLDQDNDGIPSFQEDLDGDGYVYLYANTVSYPTPPDDEIRYADDFPDKDGIPNFFDIDDDGDNYTTKLEITKPEGTNSGLSAYFPYDPIVDNPLTTAIETETKGIPEYSAAGTPDYTTPTRKRIHVDKDHHTAKP